MNVSYACPQCNRTVRRELAGDDAVLECPHCGGTLAAPAGAVDEGGVNRCLVCPGTDLFVRKDFPQRLGLLIVVAGFIASSIAWYYYRPLWTYAILLGTVLIDVVLYVFVRDSLMCYRCGAQYRGVRELDEHKAFNLETHERYRQEAARLE